MKQEASILSLYAISPCHAGSGSSTGVVDSPIQRERHTNWPVVASSGLKGALRAHFDKYKCNIQNQTDEKDFEKITERVFGSDKNNHAGAIVVSDLKLLAFPMRSNVAPFVWITCPAILKRLAKDLKLAGKPSLNNPKLIDSLQKDDIAWTLYGEINTQQVLLEDIEVTTTKVAGGIDSLLPLLNYYTKAERLILVTDNVFEYAVSNCTAITAQIAIDQATGTTKNGSLRYQEELPADSLMYAVVFWDNSRDKDELTKLDTIRRYVSQEVVTNFIQVGGDETCGRGIFEVEWK